MKLRELLIGNKFKLKRTGETFIVRKYISNREFRVYDLTLKIDRTLNVMCGVVRINDD